MGSCSHLHVNMTIKGFQKGDVIRDDHLVTILTMVVMYLAFIIDCCSLLKWFWVFKSANSVICNIKPLAVSGRRVVLSWMVVYDKLSD